MVIPNKELVRETIRLRVEQRLSLREIAVQTGAAKGSLSAWLKPYPLTEVERRIRQKTAKRYVPPKKERGEASRLYQATEGQQLSRLQKSKIAKLLLHYGW